MKIIVRIFAYGFAAIWIGFWSLCTLMFDVKLVGGIVHQAQARHWPITRGRVVAATIKVESDSESGTSYTPRIEYVYTVDGVNHEGDRVRFGFAVSGRKGSQDAMQQYPKGSE